ncbi:MAG: hypothetical protein AAF958_13515 [Planctomycetota bacterium]
MRFAIRLFGDLSGMSDPSGTGHPPDGQRSAVFTSDPESRKSGIAGADRHA